MNGRRLRGFALFTFGMLSVLWAVYVHTRFMHLPTSPDTASGRIYPFVASHTQVFLTESEARTGELADLLGSWGGIAGLAGVLFLGRAKRGS